VDTTLVPVGFQIGSDKKMRIKGSLIALTP
jgi:hypothetical protein